MWYLIEAKLASELLVGFHVIEKSLAKCMFLRPTPHPQRFQGPSLCQHVGSSWFSCSLHQPIDSPLLLPLHSQSHHFLLHWRAISLLLNKVHSNLKLPLLTLTTNGSFLFLVLLSSLNLSLSDSSSEYTYSSASDLPSSDHPLQIGLHLKPSFPCIA
ncbi:unnamed protein product [Microthlaspi erraticum]|uniref:Uncharacterized protein n=1 Tax=Microthlaspi erraticum TaxID=1685480 RepID=A0A6D2I5F7_9BRAS|nr:unnamed protein product [Microthlaspi erraticum]